MRALAALRTSEASFRAEPRGGALSEPDLGFRGFSLGFRVKDVGFGGLRTWLRLAATPWGLGFRDLVSLGGDTVGFRV